ncbi:uncharacterized protein LOC135927766 [Gordionus sp. m RMFG-2023]|uniref:uncharacterized protein LOC135927766 n=1 Tax=Gordionus sp. m RMFG-2023 TaxID=3053472 RepID=UPI0031FBEE41
MALYLNATFNSIDTLKKSIDIYEKENLINISIYKSELLKYPCSIELIKQFKYQRIFYVCKYSLKKRSRSTGLRKTSSFRKECTFNFTVIYKLDPIVGPHLVIVKFMEEHKNHDLNKNIYMLLPKQRKLSPIKKQIVEQALTFKANKVKIQDYILKTGQMVMLRDIHNLSANLNKPSTNMLIDVVNQLREDKDAIVEIHEENNELMGIFYQDIAMRHFVKCYPEVLFIDATYKLNNLGMPLFILMVIDGDGQSQIAALWLVKGETYKCVKTMCDIFGRYNIKDNIQVIIGDKDFADRQALYESFPKAEIHICIFHVMRSFKREISTGKRDIAEQDVKLVLDILQSLVYAQSQEHYDLLYLKLVNLNLPKVMAYYNNNWHNIKNEWVIGLRSCVPHFFNSTNNRVESMNQKFKAVITKFSTLKGLFKDVISIVNSMAFEKDYRSIMSNEKSSLFPYSLLSAESKYRNLLTYAFKNILNEINLSNSISIPVIFTMYLWISALVVILPQCFYHAAI